MFWSTFFRGFIFGQNAKGGGGGRPGKKVWIAFKSFILLNSIKTVLNFGKKSKGGGLGRAKNIGALFLDF